MSELDIEEMDRRIARYEARASEEERAGGASRETSAIILLTATLGLFASTMLVLAELEYVKNPSASLMCDVNPLIGCSTWFALWQGHLLFGVPNAVWGVMFFAGILALGLVLVLGGRIHRLLWQGAMVGASAGIVWVVWFAYQSYAKGSLCPYCILVWLVTIPLFYTLLARSAQAGHLGQSATSAGSALVRNRWVALALIYLGLVVFTVVWFWNSWSLVF